MSLQYNKTYNITEEEYKELHKHEDTKTIMDYFNNLQNSIENRVCNECGKKVDVDKMRKWTRKEYFISGLCKECQDKIFG